MTKTIANNILMKVSNNVTHFAQLPRSDNAFIFSCLVPINCFPFFHGQSTQLLVHIHVGFLHCHLLGDLLVS